MDQCMTHSRGQLGRYHPRHARPPFWKARARLAGLVLPAAGRTALRAA